MREKGNGGGEFSPFEIFLKRLNNYYRRKRSSLFGKKIVAWSSPHPFVSFTFDDFPRSAYRRGGKILENYKIRGSYYVSFGLLGKMAPPGEMFRLEDLQELLSLGHEIGCHTHDHLDAWHAGGRVFEESLLKNQEAMKGHFPEYQFRTFSYPIKEPHPRIKKVAGRHFWCCRGGGQTFNGDKIDLNSLQSCFIDHRNREDPGFFRELIEKNAKNRGWLIFSTHDIDQNPSAYGCSPGLFEGIVKSAVESAAVILPLAEVYSRVFGSQSADPA